MSQGYRVFPPTHALLMSFYPQRAGSYHRTPFKKSKQSQSTIDVPGSIFRTMLVGGTTEGTASERGDSLVGIPGHAGGQGYETPLP